MATGQFPVGSAGDIAARIRQLLPSWFADRNPTANALLAGAASALTFAYGLYSYAAAQSRIFTANGIWLDLIAQDFYAVAITRGPNQNDDGFRASILANLFRPRATRQGMNDALLTLTGNAPDILEPFAPADTGAYGVGYAGYGAAGGYGSQAIAAQVFITAFRPVQYGIAQVAGYSVATAGYGMPSQAEYASLAVVSSIVTDADIYAAIDATKAAGTCMWVRINNIWNPVPLNRSGAPFTVDGEQLTLSREASSAIAYQPLKPIWSLPHPGGQPCLSPQQLIQEQPHGSPNCLARSHPARNRHP